MARHVGRSRGCKSCLQRKIKCDEKLPECTQCVLRRQPCPGATVGAVFISMRPKTKNKACAKGSDDSKLKRGPSITSDSEKIGLSCGSFGIVKPASLRSSEWAGALSAQFLLPTSYQPSKAAPFEQLFLSHFISAFDNRNLQGHSMGLWYDHLPAIYNTSPYKSCQDSTRAAMMVHYGVMTSNRSIQAEAFKWYAKALESQRSFLQKDHSLLSTIMPAAEEILSPIILALFELVTSTTPTGWIDHVMGAATMLQMRKAEHCQTDLAHLVFRTIRPTIVYISMVTEEQHFFALHPWATVPFKVHPKAVYDRLLDILLLIPRCWSVENQIERTSGLDIAEEQELKLDLELTALSLLRSLQIWWQDYVEDQAKSGEDANSFGKAEPSSLSEGPYFPEVFAAACIAFYHAAQMVLYATLNHTCDDAQTYDARIKVHSTLILASSLYMTSNRTSSAGTLMMVFPLKMICRYSRDELQLQTAFEILGTWGQKKGIQGICMQAAPIYNKPAISR